MPGGCILAAVFYVNVGKGRGIAVQIKSFGSPPKYAVSNVVGS